MNCNLVLQLMRDNRRKANISNSNNDTNYIDDFWANLKLVSDSLDDNH
jgi:hypothetical protein